MKSLFFTLIALLSSEFLVAQQGSFWTPSSETASGKNLFSKKDRPAAYKIFQLQQRSLKSALGNAPSEKNIDARGSTLIISVPNADGHMEDYRVVEAPVMEEKLNLKYPEIKSYAGVGVIDPSKRIRFSYSPQEGFHAMLQSANRPTIYISPLDADASYYMVASRNDMDYNNRKFECLTKALAPSNLTNINTGSMLKNANDKKFRTYRIALAASGEFSQFFLEGDEASDASRRAEVLAAQVALITRCNGIFENDFCLRVLIIANNEDIIYLDPGSDPWPGSGLNSQTQTTIDAEIGEANYDIGHLVNQGGNGGNAGCIGCVCVNGSKGSGYTGLANWNDDLFVVDYLPHEIGHQLGGTHTFSHADDNDVSQKEPGSGTTIMGYAGITGATDVASHSHDNFHAISIQQITDYVKSTSCDVEAGISNNVPGANAGADYTIPKSTPFVLTGSGTGEGGEILTYVWEQMDEASTYGNFPGATATSGPLFRCYPPLTQPSRTFPRLENILDGANSSTWEVLPSVSRSLNFRFTVRDNVAGGGQNNSEDAVVTVDGNTGPFAVTAPNSNVVWCPGQRTVTWSVNGSDALAATVNILLSTDGGISFPTTLAAGTPNDGSQTVTIGCAYSNTARIKIEAVGNIFFDISNTNFTIGDNTPPTFTKPADVTIYKDANCNYDASVTATGDVTDEADNCDNTLNASPSDAVGPGSCDGETIITRTWTLTDDCGLSTVKVQTITITDATAPSFTAPAAITIYKDNNCAHDATVSKSGDVTDEADNCDNTLDATFSDVSVPGSCIGEEIITRTWSLSDDCGNTTTHNQVITVRDTTRPVFADVNANPASLWPPNHKMVMVTINYNVTDNCSPASAITSTLSVVSNEPVNGTGDGDTDPDWLVVDDHHVWLRAERAGNGDGRIYTVTITSTDDCGNTASTTVPVHVVHNITHPSSGKPFIVGSTVNFKGVFWDKPGNTHTAKWLFDGTTQVSGQVVEPSGNANGSVTGSYKFNSPGVYKVQMNITDQNGVTSYSDMNGDMEEIVVIYDPKGGYTHGGGWFLSAASSLTSAPTLAGKARYGFAVNYFRNSSAPKGETEFKFQLGDFEFNARNFVYLVIDGNKAQMKGTGKITGGQSGVEFILTVVDGDAGGGSNPDRIRMKIFNKNTGYVYYDNQRGDGDASNPVTAVGTNSEVTVVDLNNAGSSLVSNGFKAPLLAEQMNVSVQPNPSTNTFSIMVNSDDDKERIMLRVYDLYGRAIEEKLVRKGNATLIGANYLPGVYFIKLHQGSKAKELKLIKF